MKDSVQRYTGRAVLTAMAIAFAWFIWPTPYRADGATVSELLGQQPEAAKPSWSPGAWRNVSGGVIVLVWLLYGLAGAVSKNSKAMKDFTRRYALKAALVATVIGFVWFIWPTPYRAIGNGIMQVNRFTGVRCEVGGSCWRQPPSAPSSQAEEVARKWGLTSGR